MMSKFSSKCRLISAAGLLALAGFPIFLRAAEIPLIDASTHNGSFEEPIQRVWRGVQAQIATSDAAEPGPKDQLNYLLVTGDPVTDPGRFWCRIDQSVQAQPENGHHLRVKVSVRSLAPDEAFDTVVLGLVAYEGGADGGDPRVVGTYAVPKKLSQESLNGYETFEAEFDVKDDTWSQIEVRIGFVKQQPVSGVRYRAAVDEVVVTQSDTPAKASPAP